jgi:oligosaccharide reducing-end xylanase
MINILRRFNMKKANKCLLFVIFFVIGNMGYSRTIETPYEVGTWPGFRSAAISYTFDDGCTNQFTKAIPMFDEFDFKLTLFTVTSWSPNWTALQNAASVGHEVASHTVTHPYLNKMTIEQQTAELKNSQDVINTHITGCKCVTLAYPYCVPSDQALTSQYYIAARHCQGYIEKSTPANFYQISSLICGNVGSVKTVTDFNARFESTATSKGWCVLLIHGIDNDGGYSPLPSTTLRASLEYLAARKDKFWVTTFGNVVRYIKERDDVSVKESSNTDTRITLQVTDTLDNAIYNYPVTIRRPLPQGWSTAYVLQNGKMVDANIVEVDSNAVRHPQAEKYVMFDIVPDGNDVVLTKGPYGDFTGNNIVGMNDLPTFFKSWLVNDCNEIAVADLNADCIVNFHEFVVLAKNWLETL